MPNHWLVSVPNDIKGDCENTFVKLKEEICALTDCYRVELPSDLLVGTLDSLMALSEDLHRVDLTVEGIVRKIERQFHDLNQGDEALTIDGVPVERYLQHFSWDEAKHPHRRPLGEIVGIIQQTMSKIDEELKQVSSQYSEKKQQLSQLQKKKGGSLMVANLEDVLTPDVVSETDFINTEYLTTLVVVVPKNLEQQWLSEYFTLGSEIAEYGPSGSRGNVKGSPVVPNSARKILEEGDSTLYTITVLKGQSQAGFIDEDGNFEQGSTIDYIEDFKIRAREKRYVVRDFKFSSTAFGDTEQMIAELDVEVDRLWSGLLRWCKAHYGEAFIAWMHIKAIKVFVESVLRYGLPVDFVVTLLKPNKGKEKKIRASLNKLYGHLQPAQFSGVEETTNQTEYYPYVSNTFLPVSQ